MMTDEINPDDIAELYRLIASDRVGLNFVGRVIVFILCDEVQRLQAENARLLNVIRLQAATHQEAPEIDPVALAVAAGQAGFGWMDND